MAGIYIHIPFCRTKCSYCDFYSVANDSLMDEYLDALLLEINLKKENFSNKIVETIYFGGGTPSILKISQISKILDEIFKNYNVITNPEITLEANPNDLSIDFIKDIKNLGINRLSIGIQSLDDNILKFLRRKHNSYNAIKAIINSKENGFDNISIDLIYGIDGLNNLEWENTLEKVLKLPVVHLSAYHLGIEKDTLLYRKLNEGKIRNMDEEQSLQQYKILVDVCSEYKFNQYEISNFAKDDLISNHNSSYWNGTEYLGFGPSAHSYYMNKRFWNIADIKKYIKKLELNEIFYDFEELSVKDKFNEKIMLELRTVKGLSLIEIENEYGENKKENILNSLYDICGEFYQIKNNYLSLSVKGMFMSDTIIKYLFEC